MSIKSKTFTDSSIETFKGVLKARLSAVLKVGLLRSRKNETLGVLKGLKGGTFKE